MISDTHLLGPFRGHWFDKLRREWQMWRSFQTSLTLLSPDATFFLGDIFDEGKWSNKEGFERYVYRFDELFKVNRNTERHVVVGNHDIGFHDYINPQSELLFSKVFPNSSPVGVVKLKKETFVLVNSMAMHGDYCRLCSMAEMEIERISNEINNSAKELLKNNKTKISMKQKQPTVLMHFPLYRNNDMKCEGGDELRDIEIRQSEIFREKWDCLSKNSTKFIIDKLNPKVVFSGHTHYGCKIKHNNITEYTVASFSWRNNPMPSFLLVVYDNDEVKASKNVDVELWEIDKSYVSDIEMTTTTDHDGNFYIDKVIEDYLVSDLELVIKIFHQCNVKNADLCYKVIEIPVPTTFFNYDENDDETYLPRAYNLGTIELDTNHPLQGKSCSHILGNTVNKYIDFASKFIN
ncbi:Metallophosphoesterase 1 [Strongyloides ratti]|uniref:Metallophosphoesterase 1 n=1 Tax=Strongyloides ratti TaxID=34506 RepID=A0A090MY15_STRRB|nr:Metallophosphoesterase 1 [Strongyloides ratti]CEF66394.1 Metallophosphoesterase 1 [Strongyloides ratti]